MVRAVKLEETPSGSYYNPSQGIFQDLAGSFGPPRLSIGRAGDSLGLSWPANALGYPAGVHRRAFAHRLAKLDRPRADYQRPTTQYSWTLPRATSSSASAFRSRIVPALVLENTLRVETVGNSLSPFSLGAKRVRPALEGRPDVQWQI